MNRAKFVAELRRGHKRRDKLLLTKNHDYATKDMLSNFARVGQAALTLQIPQLWQRNPSLGAALYLLLLKVDRISKLELAGRPPANESLVDSYDDLINYAELAQLISGDR